MSVFWALADFARPSVLPSAITTAKGAFREGCDVTGLAGKARHSAMHKPANKRTRRDEKQEIEQRKRHEEDKSQRPKVVGVCECIGS